MSFWVKSSLTGTFGGALQNSDSSRSYPFTYSIGTAGTWTQISVTSAGDTNGTWLTTNGIGIQVIFGLGVASGLSGTAGAWAGADYRSATGAVSVVSTLNATWQVTGVQLEKGSQATSFDFRSIGTELALCQRYYWSTNFYVPVLAWAGTNNYQSGHPIPFPTTMRASPTLTGSTTLTPSYSSTTGSFPVGTTSSTTASYAGITFGSVSTNFGLVTNNATSNVLWAVLGGVTISAEL